MTLEVGDKAPEFSLPASTGETISLSGLAGKKVVLYFYPRDNTPGCIMEACGFRNSIGEFSQAGVVVLGISADGLRSHEKFTDRYGLNFPLLSDQEKTVSTAYGAWGEKSVFGRTTIGMRRMSFLIDEEGKIAKVWPKVKARGHAREVLEASRDI